MKHQLGMTDDALVDFNTSLEYFPYNPMAYLHRGNIFKTRGRYEEAQKDYLAYLKLNPKPPTQKKSDVR